MFAQAGYLVILYLGSVTGGDEGFVVEATGRKLFGADLASDGPRAVVAFALFSAALMINLVLVRSPFGRVMVAMRENEERSRMLGYNPFTVKLTVLVISGLFSGIAGAAYGILFGYVGASFATVQYSILPMLYVLMGGAGTVLGPLLGAGLMFYLVDITSGITTAGSIGEFMSLTCSGRARARSSSGGGGAGLSTTPRRSGTGQAGPS